MKQDQFLSVLSRDEAAARLHAHLDPSPLPEELVPLERALGRVLARDVASPVDVPSFHRANVDGFAVVARDTYGADEEKPVKLRLNPENLGAGDIPQHAVAPGTATAIATGAVIPRGASAIVMVEYTDTGPGEVRVYRPAAAGEGLSHAGNDLMLGETVLRAGQVLSARETGTLAALGMDPVPCVRRPRVAILSTGNEILAPGVPMRECCVYDSNSRIVADTVRENGGEALFLGIVGDDEDRLETAIRRGLDADIVVLSGGTSKGGGDLNYRVLSRMGPPGIILHGVALKPGKPFCAAVVHGKPVVVLPGFPTSAIVTFRDLVLPFLRRWGGLPAESPRRVRARQAIRYHSDRGRMEYLMVNLVPGQDGYRAYPWTKGSGAVTTFSQADGFVRIPANQEMVLQGQEVEVELIGETIAVPDLTSIGSHCVGLDFLLGEVQRAGFAVKIFHIGSLGGLEAARRGESDLSGIHLLDEVTGEYNLPLLRGLEGLTLVRGYSRRQGILVRPGHFSEVTLAALVAQHLAGEALALVNRNRGSGTRLLTDRLLATEAARAGLSLQALTLRIRGYEIEARSHNAVAASIASNKADWGIGIENVARAYGLEFHFLDNECYDFVAPASRLDIPALRQFLRILRTPRTADHLRSLGFEVSGHLGDIVDAPAAEESAREGRR
ncbi:MAG: molybdopterin biosynthesis protein [Planctomycetes bacterium]|nr:molybdopterin biosynthesis protein [Planctomycetota bacterium]